jgi:RNA-binding protein Luc7-like 2
MRQIDRLKEQRSEFMMMSEHPLMTKEKQMKVCDVCGAMQSLQDNEKRLQTHVEGKLHTGYLKIREHLDILRRRKLDRKLRQEEGKEMERRQREFREKDRLHDLKEKENKSK